MARKFAGFPQGGGNKGGGNMMAQAQRMQQEMLQLQEELKNREYSAESGGGMVKATVSGEKLIKTIELNPEVVDPDDIEMLQDLVVAAVNEALRAAEDDSNQTMSKLAGGLNIPGL